MKSDTHAAPADEDDSDGVDPHAAYLAFVHDLSPAARDALLAPPKPAGPAEPSELQLLCERFERLEARLFSPAPSAPSVALPGLADAAKAARLSGAQRRIVDAIARSGRMSLSELALVAGVRDLLGVLKRAKPKLKNVGWALFRHDNHIEAKPIPGSRK